MTKMVGKTRGWSWGVNFWASDNWSGRVHFEGHSPEWRVLSKLSVQPCTWGAGDIKEPTHLFKTIAHIVPGVVVWPCLAGWCFTRG